MAILSLTNQKTARDTIAPKIANLQSAMETRKEVWQRLPIEKKKKWIKSGKDPIMTLAWSIYRYLDQNFFGEVEDDG